MRAWKESAPTAVASSSSSVLPVYIKKVFQQPQVDKETDGGCSASGNGQRCMRCQILLDCHRQQPELNEQDQQDKEHQRRDGLGTLFQLRQMCVSLDHVPSTPSANISSAVIPRVIL